MAGKVKVTRFQAHSPRPGRTVKTTSLERRNVNSYKPGRTMRPMRQVKKNK